MSTKKDERPIEGSTAHQKAPPDQPMDAAGTPAPGDPMPMGMTGKEPAPGMHPDPDQKSTHVPPKTKMGVLPDGSPKFQDPEPAPKGKKAKVGKHSKAGTYKAVSRVIVPTYDDKDEIVGAHTVEPGEECHLTAEVAESLGTNVELAGK